MRGQTSPPPLPSPPPARRTRRGSGHFRQLRPRVVPEPVHPTRTLPLVTPKHLKLKLGFPGPHFAFWDPLPAQVCRHRASNISYYPRFSAFTEVSCSNYAEHFRLSSYTNSHENECGTKQGQKAEALLECLDKTAQLLFYLNVHHISEHER